MSDRITSSSNLMTAVLQQDGLTREGDDTRLVIMALVMCASSHQAIAYDLDATGADWGKDYYGHPHHIAWVGRYVDPTSTRGNMLDMCLDHITTDENEKVPKNVAKVPLVYLTTWCLGVVAPADMDIQVLRDKTFRYPDGLVD